MKLKTWLPILYTAWMLLIGGWQWVGSRSAYGQTPAGICSCWCWCTEDPTSRVCWGGGYCCVGAQFWYSGGWDSQCICMFCIVIPSLGPEPQNRRSAQVPCIPADLTFTDVFVRAMYAASHPWKDG